MLSFINGIWQKASLFGRIGLILGTLVICFVPIFSFYYLNQKEYAPLFTDMDTQDLSTLVAALEKKKVPYLMADNGQAILVDKNDVHKIRMQLLGGGIDLKGQVGFELFNENDFGATEFSQKINYQRALQGELARTIMGFNEIQNARVLLVFPENSLLRRQKTQSKASVWVTLKNHSQLSREKVNGIQRLISASVPDLKPEQVTVLDQRGIALSLLQPESDVAMSGDHYLRLKQDTENYMVKKIAHVLDTAIGEGNSAISVDVVLDNVLVKTSRESLLGENDNKGILIRSREQIQIDPEQANKTKELQISNKKIENDYQVGKEIQQILSSTGSVKKISVGIVTQLLLSDQQIEKLTRVISMAVGLDISRGDGIAFTTIDSIGNHQTQIDTDLFEEMHEQKLANNNVPSFKVDSFTHNETILCILGLLGVLILGGLFMLKGYVSKKAKQGNLSAQERQILLQQVKQWLAQESFNKGGL